MKKKLDNDLLDETKGLSLDVVEFFKESDKLYRDFYNDYLKFEKEAKNYLTSKQTNKKVKEMIMIDTAATEKIKTNSFNLSELYMDNL